jgi:hypothetical protein
VAEAADATDPQSQTALESLSTLGKSLVLAGSVVGPVIAVIALAVTGAEPTDAQLVAGGLVSVASAITAVCGSFFGIVGWRRARRRNKSYGGWRVGTVVSVAVLLWWILVAALVVGVVFSES